MTINLPLARSLLGLNAFNFFTAGVQTGFGPFLAIYLTEAGWDQGSVGLALSVGTVAGMVTQVPGGALVDHIYRKRAACAGGLAAIGISALVLVFWPGLVPVWGGQILHAIGSAVLTPAIAALTLTLSGHGAFGERLGGNARYASIGNAAAAALLGTVAYHLSHRAVFVVTALMTLPGLAALLLITPPVEEQAPDDHPALLHPDERTTPFWRVYLEPHMHTFAVCLTLFYLGNAAMLPIALNALAAKSNAVGLVTSASVIVPQAVVAVFSPWIGRAAQKWGRRPLLAVGFAALPLRGVLFAILPGAAPLVAIEVLDGVSGTVIGIMIPLVAADLTCSNGCLNLAIGSLGLATSLGATVSTALAGWVVDVWGLRPAFLLLAAAGALGLLLLVVVMPETRPRGDTEDSPPCDPPGCGA